MTRWSVHWQYFFSCFYISKQCKISYFNSLHFGECTTHPVWGYLHPFRVKVHRNRLFPCNGVSQCTTLSTPRRLSPRRPSGGRDTEFLFNFERVPLKKPSFQESSEDPRSRFFPPFSKKWKRKLTFSFFNKTFFFFLLTTLFQWDDSGTQENEKKMFHFSLRILIFNISTALSISFLREGDEPTSPSGPAFQKRSFSLKIFFSERRLLML